MPQHNPKVKIIGFDPSMLNWGIASATWDEVNGLLIQKVDVIHPSPLKGKQRKNSKDIYHAEQLVKGLEPYLYDVDIVVAEVPVGSQNAAAMKGYGMCVALLAMVNQFLDRPVIQVSPQDVKLVIDNPEASKKEMVDWAYEMHPEANWPTYKQHGKQLLSYAKAEHMADSIAAIYAASYTDTFSIYMNQLIGKKP